MFLFCVIVISQTRCKGTAFFVTTKQNRGKNVIFPRFFLILHKPKGFEHGFSPNYCICSLMKKQGLYVAFAGNGKAVAKSLFFLLRKKQQHRREQCCCCKARRLVLFLDVAYDAVLGILDEVENVLNLLAHRNLFGNLDYGIFQTEVACVDDAVSVGDVAENAIGRVDVLQHHRVDAIVGSRVATQDDVRRNILLHAAAALYQGISSHAHVLLNHHAVALDGAVVNFAFACDACTNADHAMVEHMHVVADMHAVHNEVFIADGGGMVAVGAAGYHHVFADAVVVADVHLGGAAFHVVEILWRGTDHCILVDDVSAAHGGAFKNAGMGFDHAVVADDNAFLDVGEGAYFYVLSQLCRRVDVS